MMGRRGGGSYVHSIVGEGTSLRGEFDVSGLLRVDGFFSGMIRCKGKVIVGQTGRVLSDIDADQVTIGGEVIGNILARERVELLSTARVEGDIMTPRLSVEEGVRFDGNCGIRDHRKLDFEEWRRRKEQAL